MENPKQLPIRGRFNHTPRTRFRDKSTTILRPANESAQAADSAARQAPKTFIDLFCGIGGFHVAAAAHGLECVFASDIDRDAQRAYQSNFGILPAGDITAIPAERIPDHDILFAGLPCQPFSIIGKRRGFSDARGILFFEVERIVKAKRPRVVIIENVRQFATNDGGKPLARVKDTLEGLGYTVDSKALNALDFGVPQKRERIIIIAMADRPIPDWPKGGTHMKPLSRVLEKNPDRRHYVSERIYRSRHQAHKAKDKPAIWHENKAGNVSSHPFSCALRAGASYNYLLVDGERRLTPRELFRLQGFPDTFKLPETDAAARRLTGNAVPVPMVGAVIERVLAQYSL